MTTCTEISPGLYRFALKHPDGATAHIDQAFTDKEISDIVGDKSYAAGYALMLSKQLTKSIEEQILAKRHAQILTVAGDFCIEVIRTIGELYAAKKSEKTTQPVSADGASETPLGGKTKSRGK